MTRLQDLSTELLLDILQRIPVEDVDAVSLASKRLYHASQPVLRSHYLELEQGQGYKEWEPWLKSGADEYRGSGGCAAGLLNTIWLDRRIAALIRTMMARSNCNKPEKYEEGLRPNDLFHGALKTWPIFRRPKELRSNMQIWEEVVRNCAWLETSEVDEWVEKLRSGREDAVTALLLTLIPNLMTLDIEFDEPEEVACISDMIQRFVTASQTPPPTGSNLATKALPLSKIEDFELSFRHPKGALNLILQCLQLPTVTILDAKNLTVSPTPPHEPGTAILPRPQAIKDLVFRESYIPNPIMLELLQNMTGLTYFFYSFQHPSNFRRSHAWPLRGAEGGADYTLTLDIRAIVETLVTIARSTLSRLRLSAYTCEGQTNQIASLRPFNTLVFAKIQTSLLLAPDGSNATTLAKILPASLEELVLIWDGAGADSDSEMLRKALLALAEQAGEVVPMLRHVGVEIVQGGGYRQDEELHKWNGRVFKGVKFRVDRFRCHCHDWHMRPWMAGFKGMQKDYEEGAVGAEERYE